MTKKALFLILCLCSAPLFTYQSVNPNSSYIFPIDGGRKLSPVINPQNGQGFSIGYLAITSIDNEGALNPTLDQQNANQLLKQINQMYVQIYNQYTSTSVNNNNSNCPAPAYTPPPPPPPPQRKVSAPMTGCQHRRSSKWRTTQ